MNTAFAYILDLFHIIIFLKYCLLISYISYIFNKTKTLDVYIIFNNIFWKRLI